MPEHRISPKRSGALRAAVKRKYGDVAREPRGHFTYPVGPESLSRLAYAPGWLESIPPELTARFVGVGNPFSVRLPAPGERVLDIGCGCGVDTFVASALVGPTGRATGVDPTPEMLTWARSAPAPRASCTPTFEEASVEQLPFADGSFDVAISNGALNLATDKDAAFREIARVLRPGGELVAADLIIREAAPCAIIDNIDAWST